MVYLKELRLWLDSYDEWLVQVIFAFLLLLFAHLLIRLIFARLVQKTAKSRKVWDEALIYALRLPVLFIVWLSGLMGIADLAELDARVVTFRVLSHTHDLLVMAMISWAVIRFVRRLEEILLDPYVRDIDTRFDATTVITLSKLVRLMVFFIVGLLALQSMGYSLSGILAFGGVGGVAIGFASKDLLANFFGGVMISMDRPFKVGDWIASPDKDIEGTVEYIGWRLTRIRTFDLRPLYVPNSVFATISIVNPSRMLNRRIKEIVGVRYKDARVVADLLGDVRSFLASLPELDLDQRTMVNFVDFGASTLNVQIYCFTRTCDWARYLLVKEEVLLNVIRIIHEHGAELAFPTRTVQLPTGDSAP